VPAWKPEDDPDEGGQGPYANLPKPKVCNRPLTACMC
jgi:hypothetical protein